jgi:hypothetical protein
MCLQCNGQAQEHEVMHTLALKCRDKDRTVRQQAIHLLAARQNDSSWNMVSMRIWRRALQQMFQDEEDDQGEGVALLVYSFACNHMLPILFS